MMYLELYVLMNENLRVGGGVVEKLIDKRIRWDVAKVVSVCSNPLFST